MKTEKSKISLQVNAGTRVYYADLHTDSKGDPYVTITEIPTDVAPKGKRRQRVFVHRNNWREFKKMIDGMDACIDKC